MIKARECGYNHPIGSRCPACADWPYSKGGAAVYQAELDAEAATSKARAALNLDTPMPGIGKVQWHGTDEDGGPDVGILIGLTADRHLWLGERSTAEGGGIGILVYGPTSTIASAGLSEYDEIREVIEQYVAPALKALADKPWHLDVEAVELLKKAATFLDSAAGEGLEIDGIDAMDLVTELHELLHIDPNKCFHEDAALFLDGKILGTIPEGTSGEGVDYEVLPHVVDACGEVTFAASYTPNNGIRFGLLDSESEDPNWREFDFTAEQAIKYGEALIRWGGHNHG